MATKRAKSTGTDMQTSRRGPAWESRIGRRVRRWALHCALKSCLEQVPRWHAASVLPARQSPVSLGAEPHAQGVDRRLGPVPHVELGEDLTHVVLDRLLTQPQLLGDLAVTVTLDDTAQNVALSPGQAGVHLTQPGELVQQAGSQL